MILPAIKVLKPHAPFADRNDQAQCQPRNLRMPWQIRNISISTDREVDGRSEQLLVLEWHFGAIGRRSSAAFQPCAKPHSTARMPLHLINSLLLQYPHNTDSHILVSFALATSLDRFLSSNTSGSELYGPDSITSIVYR